MSGYNTRVEYRGDAYNVQTQDKGLVDPVRRIADLQVGPAARLQEGLLHRLHEPARRRGADRTDDGGPAQDDPRTDRRRQVRLSPKRLFLIDGHSLLYRSYYAIQGLANSGGFPTGAIYGFLSALRKIVDKEKPDYLGVVFDVKGPTVRHEEFSAYKAHRKPMPEDLAAQLPVLKDVLGALRVATAEYPKYEADDALASLAARAAAKGHPDGHRDHGQGPPPGRRRHDVHLEPVQGNDHRRGRASRTSSGSGPGRSSTSSPFGATLRTTSPAFPGSARRRPSPSSRSSVPSTTSSGTSTGSRTPASGRGSSRTGSSSISAGGSSR